MVKVHSLTGRITEKLMHQAFKKVKRNRGAAGIDKVSIGMFESNLEQNLAALMRDLKRGSFEPKPLRRVFIPKGLTQTAAFGDSRCPRPGGPGGVTMPTRTDLRAAIS